QDLDWDTPPALLTGAFPAQAVQSVTRSICQDLAMTCETVKRPVKARNREYPCKF
ncbi:unnamed protein product, partial [Phaeothamnion confervicola]